MRTRLYTRSCTRQIGRLPAQCCLVQGVRVKLENMRRDDLFKAIPIEKLLCELALTRG